MIHILALHNEIDFPRTEITRAFLETLVDPIIAEALNPIFFVLEDAKLKKEEIDEIIIVGGTSRIPLV